MPRESQSRRDARATLKKAGGSDALALSTAWRNLNAANRASARGKGGDAANVRKVNKWSEVIRELESRARGNW